MCAEEQKIKKAEIQKKARNVLEQVHAHTYQHRWYCAVFAAHSCVRYDSISFVSRLHILMLFPVLPLFLYLFRFDFLQKSHPLTVFRSLSLVVVFKLAATERARSWKRQQHQIEEKKQINSREQKIRTRLCNPAQHSNRQWHRHIYFNFQTIHGMIIVLLFRLLFYFVSFFA